MIKRILIAALAIATLSFSAPVQANPTAKPPGVKNGPGPLGFMVRVFNRSNACVWVSVGYSLPTHRWMWMGGNSTARFLHPGTHFDFSDGTFQLIPSNAEVKVEGTFMEHVNCTGRHVREITTFNYSIKIEGMPQMARATGVLVGDNAADYKVGVSDGIHHIP